MKHGQRKRAADSKKETIALLSSFFKVRILHYVVAEPVHSAQILERLRSQGCSFAPASLNRILLRLARNGWLRSKSTSGAGGRASWDYSLTPKGREVLNSARERVKALVTALADRGGAKPPPRRATSESRLARKSH